MATRIKPTTLDDIPEKDNEMQQELESLKETTKKKTTTKKKVETTEEVSSPMTAPLANPNENVFQQVKMSTRTQKIEEYKDQFNSIIQNMNFDINNVELSDSLNSLEKRNNFNIIFSSRPAFQVKLAQSCYTVFMESLTLPEIEGYVNSTMDTYNTKRRLYELIYSKIQRTSIGKISFDNFLDITSFLDLNSLMYGIYMQTFPGKLSLTLTCGSCKQKFKADIPNDSIIYSKDENIFERYNQISECKTIQEVSAGSLLNYNERIILDQCKAYIDLRIPSLREHLDLMLSINEDRLNEISSSVSRMLFISDIKILNVPESIAKGKPIHYSETDLGNKIDFIGRLSIPDAEQLGDAMEEKINKYSVDFAIQSFDCPHCKKALGNIPLDIEEVLFQKMLDVAQ